MKGLSGAETERVKERVIKAFEDCGLKITIKANLHIVNFLDITLDLRNNTYKPYREPYTYPVYINKNSNHPETILRVLPKAISKRLSDLSFNKEIFQKATQIYFQALKKMDLMNLYFSNQRQIPAMTPVKNNGNAKWFN